ncbi:hypothetical protein [Psychromicrobium lacuslunae]|uniref:Uncharacterized protein n=1 Tax=Psychromicrobium lacuslunae TaxID=1618207 RepID=A0A0D4BYE6_9MICC|nr:hypothetical protein [Psychromicrobium lacuslunae]AJT41111.1 hypothetical protein UM93_05515 [Psychromicrobium lacuslunae]
MPGDNNTQGFFPPLDYAALWLVLGIVLLVLIAAWYFSAFYTTRERPEVGSIPLPPRKLLSLRQRYLSQIDHVAAQHHAGQLSARNAHQKLSILVRAFAQELTGVKTERMTLSELRAAGLPVVGNAVELFYPAEFGVQDAQSLGHSVDIARELVARWS